MKMMAYDNRAVVAEILGRYKVVYWTSAVDSDEFYDGYKETKKDF